MTAANIIPLRYFLNVTHILMYYVAAMLGGSGGYLVRSYMGDIGDSNRRGDFVANEQIQNAEVFSKMHFSPLGKD